MKKMLTVEFSGPDMTIEIPEDIIDQAADLAYDEDADQVVGQEESGHWVIRAWTDPTSDVLKNSVRVNSGGIKENCGVRILG